MVIGVSDSPPHLMSTQYSTVHTTLYDIISYKKFHVDAELRKTIIGTNFEIIGTNFMKCKKKL